MAGAGFGSVNAAWTAKPEVWSRHVRIAVLTDTCGRIAGPCLIAFAVGSECGRSVSVGWVGGLDLSEV